MHDEMERNFLKDYLKYTMPIQANYIVWGVALTATSAIIGHVSADMVAANSVASVVKDLAIVLCGGISGGGSVLIGKYLGNGNIRMAKRVGNRITVYALIFGALAGITILLIKPLIFHVLNLNDTAQGYLNGMLYICAYYCIGKSLNSTLISGIFCAGGDPKFGFCVILSLCGASFCRWDSHVLLYGTCSPWLYMRYSVWTNLSSCPPLSFVIVNTNG